MKFSIKLFDEVRFTLYFNRDASGPLVFKKGFVGFLGRPKHPHLSLFDNPNVLKPHFTAARGAPEQFRWWFPAVRSADVTRVLEHTVSAAMRRFNRVLEPADLPALQEGGWSVHWADFRALSRWLKIVMRGSRELRFDNEVVETIVTHILRKRALPTAALDVPADAFARAVALRWNESNGSVEVRPLVHFPDGVIGWGSDGEPFLEHLPGWYTHASDWFASDWLRNDVLAQVVPMDTVEAVGEQVRLCLSRYPRRKPEKDYNVPRWAMWLVGYYSNELFNQALALALEKFGNEPLLLPSA